MSDYPVNDFSSGERTGLSDHLNSEFAAVGGAVTELAEAMALGNDVLHGPGKEAGGCNLSLGTGLSCILGTGYFWVGGIRYELSEPLIIALAASQTSHLYLDAAGEVTAYLEVQSPRPVGTWYLGQATTDGLSCTAVDDSEADTVAGLAQVAERVTELENGLDAAETTLEDHEERVTNLETLGGGGGGPVYADPIPRTSSNPQTIGQKFAELDADLAALEAAGTGGGSIVALPQLNWDIDPVNTALHLQAQTTPDALEAAESQIDCFQIKTGVYGDGSDGTPNYIDPESTWV